VVRDLASIIEHNRQQVQNEYDAAIDSGDIRYANKIAAANPDVISLERQNPNPDFPDDDDADEPMPSEDGGEA
jgi:hypothetical protein